MEIVLRETRKTTKFMIVKILSLLYRSMCKCSCVYAVHCGALQGGYSDKVVCCIQFSIVFLLFLLSLLSSVLLFVSTDAC